MRIHLLLGAVLHLVCLLPSCLTPQRSRHCALLVSASEVEEAPDKLVGRVVVLQQQLQDGLHSSGRRGQPGIASSAEGQAVSEKLPPADQAGSPGAATRTHLPPDDGATSAGPGSEESSSGGLGGRRDADQEEAVPGGGTLPELQSGHQSSASAGDGRPQEGSPGAGTPAAHVKPTPAAPRPPLDPRTVVASDAFFKAVWDMQEVNRPLEIMGKFKETQLKRYKLEGNITREQLGLMHLVQSFEACPAVPSCPEFATCKAVEYKRSFGICRSSVFRDLPESNPPPHSECRAASLVPFPDPADVADGMERVAVPNPACLHASDGWWADRVPLHVFRLEDFYVEKSGVTFNREVLVVRSGCILDKADLFHEGGETEVVHLDTALGLLYIHVLNFFHTLIELLPMFLTVSPFLRKDPHLPILMNCAQWLIYLEHGQPVIGIPATDLNVVCIDQRGLLHVRELLQPMFPPCGKASPELFFELRRRFYLPQDGLPFFDPGWVPRGQRPLTLLEMATRPRDWVAVLGHRPGKERSLSVEGVIWDAMTAEFGAERCVLFNGSLHVLDAKRLFNRAALFVAAHGAALSNMVFMPSLSTVWELRPKMYPNGCYRRLAESCGLRYHLTWGAGDKDSELHVEPQEALEEFGSLVTGMNLHNVRT